MLISSRLAFKRISEKERELRTTGYAHYSNKERKKIAVLMLRVETLKGREEYPARGTEQWDRAEVAAIEWALSRITPSGRT